MQKREGEERGEYDSICSREVSGVWQWVVVQERSMENITVASVCRKGVQRLLQHGVCAGPKCRVQARYCYMGAGRQSSSLCKLQLEHLKAYTGLFPLFSLGELSRGRAKGGAAGTGGWYSRTAGRM